MTKAAAPSPDAPTAPTVIQSPAAASSVVGSPAVTSSKRVASIVALPSCAAVLPATATNAAAQETSSVAVQRKAPRISLSPVVNGSTHKTTAATSAPATVQKSLPGPTRKSTRRNNTVRSWAKSDQNLTSAIWDEYLQKERGWKSSNGINQDWAFIPGSLIEREICVRDIKRKGTEGIHFADGWEGLCTMITTYGVDHAPSSLRDCPPKLPRKFSVKEIYSLLFEEKIIQPPATNSSDVSESCVEVLTEQGTEEKSPSCVGDDAAIDLTSGDASGDNEVPASTGGSKRGLDAPGTNSKEGEKKKKKRKMTDKDQDFALSGNRARAPASVSELINMLSKAVGKSDREKEKLVLEVSKLNGEKNQLEAKCAEINLEKEKLVLEASKLNDEKNQLEAKCETLKIQIEHQKKRTTKLTAEKQKLLAKSKKLEEECNSRDKTVDTLQCELRKVAKEREEDKKLIDSLHRRLGKKMVREDSAQQRESSTEVVTQQANGIEAENEDGMTLRREIERKMKETVIPNVRWDEIIGNQNAKDTLLDLPMCRTPSDDELYEEECEDDSTGVLLFGPPGTGKTLFAKAVATYGSSNFISVSPDDILNEYVSNSEKRMRGHFDLARNKAVEMDNTSVIFFDECDRLFGKPGLNDSKVDSNIIGIFQECMDGVREPKGQVVVIGATNYPERLPPAILSRFRNKIEVSLPGPLERIAIIKLQIKMNGKEGKPIRTDMDEAAFTRLVEDTDGASGRDIRNLVKNALSARRISTKKYCGSWRKDEDGFFIPCPDSRGEAEFSYAMRPARFKVRLPPLAYNHFQEAMEKDAVLPEGEELQ